MEPLEDYKIAMKADVSVAILEREKEKDWKRVFVFMQKKMLFWRQVVLIINFNFRYSFN